MAILLVLWAHQGNVFYPTAQAYLRGGLFYFGTWGVPIFFGLSGLLITKLLLEEHGRAGRLNLRAFYVRRCFRILPPMFLYLAVVAGAGLLHSRTELWSCIFFFRNYLPWQQGSWYSGHLWSLSVEEHFYLFWPALLAVMAGRNALHKAWIPAVGLSLLCALWRFFNLIPGNDGRTDLRLDSLLLGAALAFVLHSKEGREVLYSRVSRAVWALLFALLLAAAGFEMTLAASVLIPLLIAGTVTHPRWAVSRALEWAPLRGLGRISYSLYLWQQIFLYPPWQPKPIAGGVQVFPVSLVAAFSCAVASYYLVERPFIRLGRTFAGRL